MNAQNALPDIKISWIPDGLSTWCWSEPDIVMRELGRLSIATSMMDMSESWLIWTPRDCRGCHGARCERNSGNWIWCVLDVRLDH